MVLTKMTTQQSFDIDLFETWQIICSHFRLKLGNSRRISADTEWKCAACLRILILENLQVFVKK